MFNRWAKRGRKRRKQKKENRTENFYFKSGAYLEPSVNYANYSQNKLSLSVIVDFKICLCYIMFKISVTS